MRTSSQRRLIAVTLAAAMISLPQAAAAGPREEASARYAEAERAAEELRFEDALRGYREALARDPSAPFARAARARIAYLDARAEGGFGPLAKLEAARREPARLGEAEALEAFAREVEAFPPGRVRVEARVLLADALEHRRGDPGRAAKILDEVLADPAADQVTRALSLQRVVAIHRARGDLGAARAEVLRFPDVAPELRAEVLRLWRRVTLRWVAVGVLGLLALTTVGALVRAGRGAAAVMRKAANPTLVSAALYVGAAGAILARLHGGADPRPFLWVGVGTLGVAIAARAVRLSLPRLGTAARAAWALGCALGVVAAAYLALERTDVGYLEGFGL